MSPERSFKIVLSAEAEISVRFLTRKGKLQEYGITLVVYEDDEPLAVRLYDNAHGDNHMHRYTKEGTKLGGKKFHSGEAGEAMNAALERVKTGYERMIEGWRRR